MKLSIFNILHLFFSIINPMKTPSKSPDVSLQTPLASGMALASTSAPDVLLLLQQQAALWASQQHEIQHLQAEIKQLKLALAHHARMRFGIKSEAFNGQQRDLFAEDWQVDDTDLQQHLEQLSSTSKVPRVRAGRQALAAHLPRIEVRHEPASCTCEQCGQALKLIRDEVVEKLDIIPIQFQVIRHIYPQMACRHCETIVAEPSELSVIDGGLATARLLAWVMVSKFVDHLPLYV